MVRASLPPGFRFHPTDVELVMYYLKRKVLGKKLLFEAISELNIYQFSPKDLPDKSCLKTKDLVWYFFCPRERKYASGSRTKRATETGFWKATGKDRQVLYKGKGVGMVKTLVFHTGSAPNGERTDWVIHEYRIEYKDLADKGVALDTYVLCKLFHKNGRGPNNGAQYGAPFQEEDWDNDSEIHVDSLSHDGLSPLVPVLQQKQNASAVLSVVDLGQSSGLSLSEPGPSVICPSVDDVLFYGQNGSVLTSTDPATAQLSPQNDEIIHLLRSFSEDEVVYLDQGRKVKSLPNSDGSDPFNGLEDLSNLAEHNGSGHNNFFDAAFLELDDLTAPLNFSTESCVGETQTGGFESCGVGEIQTRGLYPCKFTGSQNVLTGSLCTNYNTNGDLRQFCYRDNFPNDEAPPTDFLLLPKVPSSSDHPRNSTNVFPMGNFCDGRIPALYLDWTSYKQEEMGNAAGMLERGGSHNF